MPLAFMLPTLPELRLRRKETKAPGEEMSVIAMADATRLLHLHRRKKLVAQETDRLNTAAAVALAAALATAVEPLAAVAVVGPQPPAIAPLAPACRPSNARHRHLQRSLVLSVVHEDAEAEAHEEEASATATSASCHASRTRVRRGRRGAARLAGPVWLPNLPSLAEEADEEVKTGKTGAARAGAARGLAERSALPAVAMHSPRACRGAIAILAAAPCHPSRPLAC